MAGRSFDSKGERDRGTTLSLMERAKEIRDLEFQVRVHLTCQVYWRLDYKYFDLKKNVWVYEDFKGIETEAYRIKRKLWAGFGPAFLRISKRTHGGGITVVEEHLPGTTAERYD